MRRTISFVVSVVIAAALMLVTMIASGVIGQNFEGLGKDFIGPDGTMPVTAASPDPSGAVGPDHYVQAVNAQLAIFDKTGVPLAGPVPLNSLWTGFGGDCEANNDGEANVLYDHLADRWVISQISTTGADGTTHPYLACVAVSTTGDPAGSYFKYAFEYMVPPSQLTLSVWPDASYAAFDTFGAVAASDGVVCAYDRDQMLAGLPATQQCLTVNTGARPAGLTGDVVPPAGTAYLLSLGANKASLDLRALHVDWTAPATFTLDAPLSLSVAKWSDPASPSVPQSGGALLDPLAGRLMRPVSYRLFSDGHAAIVANHAVVAGASTGIRWYEINVPNAPTAPTAVRQQGTWSPDIDHRWAGALAMDGDGNIGLGYNVSSPTTNPQLRFTGRLASDPDGVMTQGEATIVAGAGAQAGVSAWGRFSSMSVDPSDDCTFWFSGEYLASDGSLNWHTRVASFALPGCGTPAGDFAIAANSKILSAVQGTTVQSAIATSVVTGSPETIDLSISGVPAGATASFNPASVTTGSSATLSLSAGNATPGTYTIAVTGTSPGATHSLSIAFTVLPSLDFALSIAPGSRTIPAGASASYVVSSALLAGAPQAISLSISGLPAGVTATLTPTIPSGGSGTLTLTATTTAALGPTPFTVSGVAGGTVRQAKGELVVADSSSTTPFPLVNAVPVTGLNRPASSQQYFVLDVPTGQSSLKFVMTGSSGDADMYVRFGSVPTLSSYSCRPYLPVSNETCNVTNPQAGLWFVMIRGYSAYSGVTLTGTYSGGSGPSGLLTNGVPVTNISGASNSNLRWQIALPANVSQLTVKISGGSGDADLYVRRGSQPTLSAYDCRPYLNGNTETCTFLNPQAGDWFVLLHGYTPFSGVTLTATWVIGSPVTVLSNGVPITGISGASSSQQFWKITVPTGRPSLEIRISGGTGDADLYVRFGSNPTTSTFACRPYLNGNNETCHLNNPQPGDWFVMLRGYTAFTGVTLRGQY